MKLIFRTDDSNIIEILAKTAEEYIEKYGEINKKTLSLSICHCYLNFDELEQIYEFIKRLKR